MGCWVQYSSTSWYENFAVWARGPGIRWSGEMSRRGEPVPGPGTVEVPMQNASRMQIVGVAKGRPVWEYRFPPTLACLTARLSLLDTAPIRCYSLGTWTVDRRQVDALQQTFLCATFKWLPCNQQKNPFISCVGNRTFLAESCFKRNFLLWSFNRTGNYLRPFHFGIFKHTSRVYPNSQCNNNKHIF